MNKVIITIPVYNGEKFIEECLLSAIEQTRRPDKIVVSDNASTDLTRKIVKTVINNYRDIDIVLYQNTENLGYHKNLNMCLEYGKGFDYQLILYADDKLKPGILENHLSYFDKNPALGWVASKEDKIDEKGNIFASTRIDEDKMFNKGEIYEYIMHTGQYVADSAILYDRNKVDKVGYYETDNIFSNEIFNLKFIKQFPVLICKDSFVYRRVHPNSQLYEWTKSKRREYITAFKHIHLHADFEERIKYRNELNKYYKKRAVRALTGLAGYSISVNKNRKNALIYLANAWLLNPLVIFKKSFERVLVKSIITV